MDLRDDGSDSHLEDSRTITSSLTSSGEDTGLNPHLRNSSCTNTPPESDMLGLNVTARAYQYEMLEKSLKENVIVVVSSLLRLTDS